MENRSPSASDSPPIQFCQHAADSLHTPKRWSQFRDISNDKTYAWGPKDDYVAWLPAGDYEVSRLGNRQGAMGAYSKPLRFTVVQGQLNYLGELVYGCSTVAQPVAVYGVLNCGFLALGECTVPRASVNVCVVDRQDQAIKHFLHQHPEQSRLPVHNALMSRR
jgi:hypothetical protein